MSPTENLMYLVTGYTFSEATTASAAKLTAKTIMYFGRLPQTTFLTGFATVLFTVAIKIRTAEARRVTCGHRMLQKVQTDGSTSITEPILTTA